jgi:hypothetical protein
MKTQKRTYKLVLKNLTKQLKLDEEELTEGSKRKMRNRSISLLILFMNHVIFIFIFMLCDFNCFFVNYLILFLNYVIKCIFY